VDPKVSCFVLLSFIPDAEGTSHLKLGMVHPFTVS
jgi:hypothetical protein